MQSISKQPSLLPKEAAWAENLLKQLLLADFCATAKDLLDGTQWPESRLTLSNQRFFYSFIRQVISLIMGIIMLASSSLGKKDFQFSSTSVIHQETCSEFLPDPRGYALGL